MMEQSQVSVGAEVVTANGQPAGKVIALRAQDFIVEGGIFIKYICSYQFDDVTSATPDRVELKLDTQALEQPWNVTEWTDPQGVEHHIRQVGVPMTTMSPPADTPQPTQDQPTV